MAHCHVISSNELFATLHDWEYILKRSPSALAIIKGDKNQTYNAPKAPINELQKDLVPLPPIRQKRRPARIAGG
jgi:hypothetical protein